MFNENCIVEDGDIVMPQKPNTIKKETKTNMREKYEMLKKNIANLGSAAIAFSSGVDSTFLLHTVHVVLGDKVLAVTARSHSFPKRELDEAAKFCKERSISHIICDSEELNIDGFSHNPPNRCYLCKSELFTKIRAIAAQNGIENVMEASNADDEGDYRPGLKAICEQGIKSPLRDVRLTKNEIRALSKELGLATWNKQSFACLSSRFPYGEEITIEKLNMIDRAEQFLLDMGFTQIRVRCHGILARIETNEDGFSMLSDAKKRKEIFQKLREIGFVYICIDIMGYRLGSMNETLPKARA
jgi:uncharacterized protein